MTEIYDVEALPLVCGKTDKAMVHALDPADNKKDLRVVASCHTSRPNRSTAAFGDLASFRNAKPLRVLCPHCTAKWPDMCKSGFALRPLVA